MCFQLCLLSALSSLFIWWRTLLHSFPTEFYTKTPPHIHKHTFTSKRHNEKFTVIQINTHTTGFLRKCSERTGVSFHIQLSWGLAWQKSAQVCLSSRRFSEPLLAFPCWLLCRSPSPAWRDGKMSRSLISLTHHRGALNAETHEVTLMEKHRLLSNT